MTMYRKPPQLRPGDTIAVISPSSTIQPFPRRLERGIHFLEEQGFRVKISENGKAASGKAAGTPEQRAADIHACFSDPSIKAIICSTGGYNANSVLPLLDYDLIGKNPKIFCGYSDITALNLAISTKARIVTFNGPTVLPSFGECGGPFSFTVEQFIKVTGNTGPIGVLPASAVFSDENLWWEKEDDRPSATQPAPQPHTIHKGQAEGVLLGGNLETLTMLGGTEYLPDFSGSILFLEEMGGSTDVVERNLTYLEQLGVFKQIAGLIYGRPYRFTDDDSRSLNTILSEFARRYNLPAITNVDCGHTNPMLTMPLGVHATLDADNAIITIPESAVTAA